MTRHDQTIQWASKVPQWKLRRLYETDARGIVDEEQIAAVGWALWQRCDSILTVTAAHYGQVGCPACDTIIERHSRGFTAEMIACPMCGWTTPWADYHRTYRGKQLFGANAVDVFKQYHQAFPQAQTPQAKMLLIDRLIHAFHVSLQEIGRPAAANLIQGSLADVIRFLDTLTNSGTSATGLDDSRDAWRRTLAAAAWFAQLNGPKRDS
ncbi:MAG: hypothetical protein M3R24_02290 [Chloroflexota bacterium]|nr:hypothetical protein [Chloroflexota bacterium]PLS80432.1 MAG: hypothetical protein CYG59_08055 [Chloroflexota bacterium]